MRRKTVSGIMLSLLLIGMLILTFNIQPVKSDWTWTETIYIRADGSVDPDTAPISTVDNITYTLIDNIVADVPQYSSAIAVERDNIVVDGAGYTIQGTSGTGIDLSNRSNVIIKNTDIKELHYGILLHKSSNNSISGNNITNNNHGIYVWNSSNIRISENIIIDSWIGICVEDSSPTIKKNVVTHNYFGINIIGEFSSPTIVQNLFANNGQAAINTWEGASVIINNLIIGAGIGIRMQRSSPVIVSNTIVKCDLGIQMYPHYASPPSSPTVINNIIAYSVTVGITDVDGDAELTLSHNDLWNPGVVNYYNCVPGIGDISADPMFIDAVDGDYHLQSGSPCIDAGINEDAPIIDFEGSPRPIDGNSDGVPVVDMGAYEFMYAGTYYQIAINSSPITTIQFKINGTPKMTPYAEWLLEGFYALEMPETHNGYVWSHWLEDGDPNRTKTVSMNANITLTGVFFHMADLNHDGAVGMRDISLAAAAFGSYPDHPRWNLIADINEDSKVDMRDLATVARNFGETI